MRDVLIHGRFADIMTRHYLSRPDDADVGCRQREVFEASSKCRCGGAGQGCGIIGDDQSHVFDCYPKQP
jgi:hypothetical protein